MPVLEAGWNLGCRRNSFDFKKGNYPQNRSMVMLLS
jgi:hypothetical protein